MYWLSLPYLKLNNDVKQFCTCVNKIKQTIRKLILIVAVILDGRVAGADPGFQVRGGGGGRT